MLTCALQGQEKMSKSDPASAIFMEDSEAEVRTKLKKAFAAPGEVSHGTTCCFASIHLVLQADLAVGRGL